MSTPPKPPRWTQTLLRLLIRREDREFRLGDFEETFSDIAQRENTAAARARYARLVLRSAPALLWATVLWKIDLGKNYLLPALRLAKRQKLFVLVNVGGLALGMLGFVLMTLYARQEMRVDGFHESPDRIHRVIRRYENTFGRAEALIGGTPAPLVPVMKGEFSQVSDGARVGEVGGMFRRDDLALASDGLFADEGFLRIFRFPLEAGDASSALAEPSSLVITRRLARRLFGRDDPMGQIVSFSQKMNIRRRGSRNARYDLKITGVAADPPAQSHLRFDYLISLASIPGVQGGPEALGDWRSSSYYSYVRLRPGAGPASLDAGLASYAERFRKGDKGTYILQPLGRIHWEPVMDDLPGNRTNDPARMLLVSFLAVLILVVAGINVMNLAVSRYSKRAKEIGLRKVFGARRRQLVGQFLLESVLMSFLAAGLALLSAAGLLPRFSSLIGSSLDASALASPGLLAIVLGMALATGLLSGLYPALYLSSLRPAWSLRGRTGRRAGRSLLRHALVGLQFAFSIFSLAGMLVVAGQLRFVQAKDLGYDREHVVVIPLRDEAARKNGDIIKSEILRDTRFASAAGSEYVPLERNNITTVSYRNAAGEPAIFDAYTSGVGFDFLDVFKLRLVQGRDFSKDIPTDIQSAVLVNEALVRKAGWADPVGKIIDGQGTRIIGVLADFHQSSLHDPIDPMVISLRPRDYDYLSVRLRPGDTRAPLEALKRTIEGYGPEFPFEFYFQDDYAAAQYDVDLRFGKTFGSAAALAVLIACLGVFGLVSFTTEQRTKEIAVRKILGASTARIARLFSLEYAWLAGLACLPAWPLSWLFMKSWLQSFAFRTEPRLAAFLLAGATVAVIAVAAAGLRSLAAGRGRPAENLRVE